MALAQAVVPEKPDLACIGVITKVGEVKQSEGSKFHSIPLEIKGKSGSPDGRYYYTFQPRWFQAGFDPRVLIQEDKEYKEAGQKAGQYFLYCRNIAYANARRPGALEALLGEGFAEFASTFDSMKDDDVTPDVIEQALREVLVGAETGYILKQRTDEEGNPSENYSVDYLFKLDVEGLKGIEMSAASTKRKRPLIMMWNEDTPF